MNMPKRKVEEIADDKAYNDFKAMFGITVTQGKDKKVDLTDKTKKDKKKLNNGKRKVEAARKWVMANRDKLKLKNYTSRDITSQLTKAEDVIDAAITLQEQMEIDQKNAASLSVVPSGTDDKPGNGKCYISFVSMGLGDCTLITTPFGRRIMIDCGSDSLTDVILEPYDESKKVQRDANAFDTVTNSLKSKIFLAGSNKLDMLLLTHPDKDHYNMLDDQLKAADVQQIEIVYFGGTESWDQYGLKNIKKLAKNNLHCPILRQEEKLDPSVLVQLMDGKPIGAKSGKPQDAQSPYVDPATNTIVLYYEQKPKSTEPDFKLSLLAANVYGAWTGSGAKAEFVSDDQKIKGNGELKLDATPQNKRSLVVLVEFGGEGFLMCGDATASTEAFIVSKFKKCLEKVTHLRMGHHGSATSSAAGFIKAMPNLRLAVASTSGQYTVKHNLPKKKILAQYAALAGDALPHSIWSFDKDESPQATTKDFLDLKTQLWTTGSNGTRHFPPFAPKVTG
jgi:beta-lactamase superfamily II metal-dependent hydrolase